MLCLRRTWLSHPSAAVSYLFLNRNLWQPWLLSLVALALRGIKVSISHWSVTNQGESHMLNTGVFLGRQWQQLQDRWKFLKMLRLKTNPEAYSCHVSATYWRCSVWHSNLLLISSWRLDLKMQCQKLKNRLQLLEFLNATNKIYPCKCVRLIVLCFQNICVLSPCNGFEDL
jgi:hypothetical protein